MSKSTLNHEESTVGGSHIALTVVFEDPQNTAAPQHSPLMPHKNQ